MQDPGGPQFALGPMAKDPWAPQCAHYGVAGTWESMKACTPHLQPSVLVTCTCVQAPKQVRVPYLQHRTRVTRACVQVPRTGACQPR